MTEAPLEVRFIFADEQPDLVTELSGEFGFYVASTALLIRGSQLGALGSKEYVASLYSWLVSRNLVATHDGGTNAPVLAVLKERGDPHPRYYLTAGQQWAFAYSLHGVFQAQAED
jgi:hypothetical protein